MESLLELVPEYVSKHPPTGRDRKWIKGKEGEIYIRLSDRLVRNDDIGILYHAKSLELANIQLKEKFQRKGILTKLLQLLIGGYGREIIYIEGVEYQWFQDWLEKNGYKAYYPKQTKPIVQDFWKFTTKGILTVEN
jgi:hypothetical protein